MISISETSTECKHVKQFTLNSLADQKQWVGWKYVERNGKKQKVPYNNNGPARTNDPRTFLTQEQAILVNHADGTGIILGDLGNGFYLCGIDFDTCISEDGQLAAWALPVIEKLGATYVETSPSGTGIKAFFLANEIDIPSIHMALSGKGEVWKPERGDHAPAIEFYTAGRYFTVTYKPFRNSIKELRIVDADVLLWLIQEYGPEFEGVPYEGGSNGSSTEFPNQDRLRASQWVDVRGLALAVPPEKLIDRKAWLKFGRAIYASIPDDIETAREIFLEASFGDIDYNSGCFDTLDPPHRVGIDHLIELAGEAGAPYVFTADTAEPPTPPRDDDTFESNQDNSQAKKILRIVNSASLFHTTDKTAYADLKINGHRETWPVRSKGFARWLGHEFYKRYKNAPNPASLQSALGVIEAQAHYDAPERAIYLRVGEHGGNLYLDLGDETWRAVEIDSDGWRIVAEPPVRFRRAAGMLALSEPTRGGSLGLLRNMMNVAADHDFHLAVAWLLAAFRPRGPYPLLIIAGEQGSAKTTFARILRSLIDPNSAPQRSLPREDRDLFIAANNGHVLSFDNVSGLPAWISDTLCRLSTGGGFAVRTLYSDSDETLFDAMRPITMTGIEDVVSRPDLAERSIFLTLAPIPETARRTEKELDAELEAVRSQIIGALLDAVATGLRRLPETRLARLPRMADFALWATACGDGVLWEAGGFMVAHDANRAGAVNDIIEADPVANAIKHLVEIDDRSIWSGTASDLLSALANVVGAAAVSRRGWPGNARVLANKLRRSATSLRAIGINLTFYAAGKTKTRMIRIEADATADAKTGSHILASAGNPQKTSFAGARAQRAQESPPPTLAGLLALPLIN